MFQIRFVSSYCNLALPPWFVLSGMTALRLLGNSRQPNECCSDNPCRHATEHSKLPTRHDLRNKPNLAVAAASANHRHGEDLKPPHRLGDSSMHCTTNFNIKPQTADHFVMQQAARKSAYNIGFMLANERCCAVRI